MSDKVWVELVKTLLAARAAWLAAPRPPLDRSQHGAMAHAIDAFNDAVAGKWDEVVSADGLTLEDLAGEDLGDSDAEGQDDDDDDNNKGISDEVLWGLITHAEIPSRMEILTLGEDMEMGGEDGEDGEKGGKVEEKGKGEREGTEVDAREVDE